MIEVEAMEAGKTWSEVKRLAVDRTQWRRFTMPHAPEEATGIKKKSISWCLKKVYEGIEPRLPAQHTTMLPSDLLQTTCERVLYNLPSHSEATGK
jgi:hypothetical protein